MLKVAIVGCGKIADSHALQIQRIPDCEIVGVCDREPLMARQLYERFPIKNHYSDLEQMLREARPDVVQITTPPESHVAIGRACMDAGAHVYVEKPFALDETDTRVLISHAESRGLKITAGHDDQYRHAARRMRSLVGSGYLGEGFLHMESYYGYELSKTGYAGAALGDKNHWLRKLPGKLLHNIISHGIARIAEFMVSDTPEVIAMGFCSPFLQSMGENELIDELRVIVRDGSRATAYFTFSSQMRPSLHQFRMYGTKNGLIIDQDQETLVRLPGTKLKSFAEPFLAPLGTAKQHVANVAGNFKRFLDRDFHMKAGMGFLISSFYESIRKGSAPPIPYREIILTAHIMDSIFAQLNAQQNALRAEEPCETR